MLKIDLEAAGIPYVVDGPHGPLHADFHSLRHSFITLLERPGVSPKTAQELARHSDVRLTLQRYTHKTLIDLAAAVERLPSILPAGDRPERESLRSTGTEGKIVGPATGTKLALKSDTDRLRLIVRENDEGGKPRGGEEA